MTTLIELGSHLLDSIVALFVALLVALFVALSVAFADLLSHLPCDKPFTGSALARSIVTDLHRLCFYFLLLFCRAYFVAPVSKRSCN